MAPSPTSSPMPASSGSSSSTPPSSPLLVASRNDPPLVSKDAQPSKLGFSSGHYHPPHHHPTGGNTPIKFHHYRDSREFVCGWGSALINTCITFPINKLIFRQQLHGISGLHAFRQLRKDGLRHLYRGLLPPLLQKTTSISIMFGVYTNSKKTLESFVPSLTPKATIILSALIAGTLEATLTPFERVQTLMQTRKYHNRFTNTFDAFSTLWRCGFREYYRGLSVIILRNGPSNCLFFLGREYLKVTEDDNSAGEKFAKDFISGACLGAFISTLFFPFNVMKTHMQAQLGGPYVSIWTTFRNVLAERDGNIRNLYKGVHLNYTRSFLAWGIINASYEILMKFFKYQDNSASSSSSSSSRRH